MIFSTRFGYGKVIAEMSKMALEEGVEVEMFCKAGDEDQLFQELAQKGIKNDDILINLNYSGTAITTTGFPIIGRNDNCEAFGLTYQTYDKTIDNFGKYICQKENLAQVDLGFYFNSASVVVNDNLAFICNDALCEGFSQFSIEEKKNILHDLIKQEVYFVNALSGDYTKDLDTYLWPIKDKVWLSADYPINSPQRESILPAIELLQNLGETVHLLPSLEKIIYDDINTQPNYQNGVLINNLAIVPAYNRKEDLAVCQILQEYGFKVKQVDCRNIVNSNAILHCISRTRPKSIVRF